MSAYRSYFRHLYDVIEEMVGDQGQAIETAASWVAETITAKGVVHLFGSGHSHMVAEEVFHRAGSMLPLNPMLDSNLTFLGHLNATLLERTPGYGQVVIDSHDIRPREVVFIISNSGVNSVPVDAALAAGKRGARTVSISSVMHYRDVPARTESGQKLSDVVDLAIDTHVPRGDAIIKLPGVDTPVGGVSSAVGIAIINAIVVEAASLMAKSGVHPPVIPSMNVPNGDEHMEKLVAQYGDRLPLLRHA
jgi:uncharacterized phosphosugar-binding protein